MVTLRLVVQLVLDINTTDKHFLLMFQYNVWDARNNRFLELSRSPIVTNTMPLYIAIF